MRKEGVTAIINSHHLDEIERLCDRVAFIKQGRIAALENLNDGTPMRMRLEKLFEQNVEVQPLE